MRGLNRIKKEIMRVRRRFVPGALILMYHRVIDLPVDPYLLAVSPDNFRKQLHYIKSTSNLMTLMELYDSLKEGKLPKRAVAITFDDGYIDVLEQAYPIMKEMQVPATVYIPSGHIGSHREFWWDDLERLLLLPDTLPDTLRLKIDGENHEWNRSAIESREQFRSEIYTLVKPLKHDERISVLDQLAAWTGLGSNGRPEYRTMDESEIRQLSRDGSIEIGAHTVTHPALSSLSPEDQRREITTGQRALEEITGSKVQSFAYPYGDTGDFTQETAEIVEAAGFLLAVTTVYGSVEPGDDVFQLNRCAIHNWDMDTFIRNIEHFFALRP